MDVRVETVKKAEHRRIDAFELWCWRRLLIVPWTARRSNQSTLKEISPGISSEGMMLKLKLQYFGWFIYILLGFIVKISEISINKFVSNKIGCLQASNLLQPRMLLAEGADM